MSVTILDANGDEVEVLTIADLVAVVSTAALQGTGNTALSSILAALQPATVRAGANYQSVPASQTAVALGANGGALGDRIDTITIIPANLNPGVVQIKDGSDTAITIFAGGAGSVTNLVERQLYLSAVSKTGIWQITTGADVSVLVTGDLT
jgi:hypothetical protein